jgi:hypothetical protein
MQQTAWKVGAVFVALALLAPLMQATSAEPSPAGAFVKSPTDLGAEVDASGPGRLIQTAATTMLTALDSHRAAYRRDPQKLRQPVS